MKLPVVGVALCLLLAGSPAFAQAPPAPAAPSAAAPRHLAAHRKAAREKAARTAAVPAALAAIPEAERLTIQSDLVWLGSFEGMSAEEIDAHTVEAIRAFQRRHNGKETGVLSEQERVLLANAARAPQAAVGWRLIEDTATGARLGLPEKLVPRAGTGRTGSRWSSGHGQIEIETFRLREASLPVLFEQEKKTAQRRVGSSALGANSFVITGEQRLKKFVVRAQASGSEVRGVTILYDQATEGTMAPVAIAVADTFLGFPDPNGAPPAGRGRAVAYGTAIVASSRGYLITAAGIVDRCQAITVPGFGHADRVAIDASGEVALLRLYGAHNLAPVALAGGAVSADALSLYGIADPVAQQGDSKVTSAPVHLTADGIEPTPNPGFAGAAAVDAQGRFAGMVEFKGAAVAGSGAPALRASLVPTETLRAFLQAQGIAAGAAHAATDQSVLRVICVRS